MNAPLVRRSPAHRATVIGTEAVTPRMRRVTLHSEALRAVAIRPAQDVELLLREESGRRVKRRYTIRHARPDAGELDLDVVLHGAGPGARWGVTAAAGDEVEFQGPRGKLELRPAPHHLLIGDESALPAIATIVESLPPGEGTTALIEVQDTADEQPLSGTVNWVHRGAAAAGAPDLLGAALAAVPDAAILAGTRAYLLGESRAMITLRAAVEARGIAHDDVFVKGYWNVGRPDRLAGRSPS